MDETATDLLAKTARARGAVGPRAIVPRYLFEHFADRPQEERGRQYILDFGAGREYAHSRMLWDAGFKNTYPVDRSIPATHTANLHRGVQWALLQYDWILLSNVLNVQENRDEIPRLLRFLSGLLKPGGFLLLNLPESPRGRAWCWDRATKERETGNGTRKQFMDEDGSYLLHVLHKMGFHASLVGGTPNIPLYLCMVRP